MSSLIEYIYVDERRLNAYVDQICSPVMYDKLPNWTVEMSLLGPKVGGAQNRAARFRTTNEKVEVLLDYLERTEAVAYTRSECKSAKIFRKETCEAFRIFLPPKGESTSQFAGITLWISPPKKDGPESLKSRKSPYCYPGSLLLLEDFPRSDLFGSGTVSGWSVLLMLDQNISTELKHTTIGEQIRQVQFARIEINLIDRLGALGAVVGPSRLISVLYRIRATGELDRQQVIESMDENPNAQSFVSTFAYPIYIAEAEEAVP